MKMNKNKHVIRTDKATSVSSWLFAAITPYLDGCLQTKYDLNKNNTTAEAATKFYYDKDTTLEVAFSPLLF